MASVPIGWVTWPSAARFSQETNRQAPTRASRACTVFMPASRMGPRGTTGGQGSGAVILSVIPLGATPPDQRSPTGLCTKPDLQGKHQEFLEELFGTRHGLLAVSNMATLGHQIYQRMSALGRFIPLDCQPLVADLKDQFARVAGVAD